MRMLFWLFISKSEKCIVLFSGGKDKEIVKWLNEWSGKIDEKVKGAGRSGQSQSQFSVAVFSCRNQIVTGYRGMGLCYAEFPPGFPAIPFRLG